MMGESAALVVPPRCGRSAPRTPSSGVEIGTCIRIWTTAVLVSSIGRFKDRRHDVLGIEARRTRANKAYECRVVLAPEVLEECFASPVVSFLFA